MDGVAVQLSYHLRRPVAFLLLVAALGVVALSWSRVAQTIFDAKPVPVTGRATAVVWGDRVFGSRAKLAAWLHARGATYKAWSRKHPVAGAVIEHRPVKLAARRPAPTRRAHTTPARRAHTAAPRPQPVHKVAAAKHSAPAVARPSGDSVLRQVLVALLILLAAVCAWGALFPSVFRERFPRLAFSVGRYRELFLTGAVALVVGLVIGVTLN
jgi:hypothetical protein